MKNKLIKILEKKGIKINEDNFELVEGINEETNLLDNILVYSLNCDECYISYESTNDIYYIKNDYVEKIK